MSTDIEKANAHSANHAAPAPPAPRQRLANPAVLGLFSFASTTLILSLYNAQTRHITTPNAVIGMALFCGGLAQLLAGMWEFPRGNTFGATAFSSYGAFWLSYATILIPGSGVLAAYEGGNELSSALGIYLITWAMVTFFFFIASLRKPLAFPMLFGFLTVTFCCLAGGEWGQSTSSAKAGGVLGAITAMIAYYIGIADMLADEPKAVFRPPLGNFSS